MEGRKEGFGAITNETIIHGVECKARMLYIITNDIRLLKVANIIRTARDVVSMFNLK